MAIVDPDQTITTDMQTATTSYSAGQEPWNKNADGFIIGPKTTETNSYQSDWDKWHGIYREVPEMRSTIDVWCKWLIGKKLTMSPETARITSRIKGNGKDTIRKILLNLKRVSKIGGDAYGEIIRDKAKRIVNIKVLDPATIQIRANKWAIITSYVQLEQKPADKTMSAINTTTENRIINSWKPEEIFHVLNDRIADEIHGIPEIEKLLKIIKWRQQSMSDMSVVFHRYVKPLLEIHANTDDPTELANLKVQYDNAVKNMENLIVPKGSIEKTERISIPQFSTLDPLPWLLFLRSYFTESSGVPEIIRGKSDEVSLAAGKLNYLAFKEKIEIEQTEFSEDIEAQLGLKIKFEAPKEIDIEIAKEVQQMTDRKNAKQDKTIISGKDPAKNQTKKVMA